jgi:hypothetical protein
MLSKTGITSFPVVFETRTSKLEPYPSGKSLKSIDAGVRFRTQTAYSGL